MSRTAQCRIPALPTCRFMHLPRTTITCLVSSRLAVWPSGRLAVLVSTYRRSNLLQQAGGVHLGLELNHFSAADGEEGDAGELDRLPGWSESEQVAVMCSSGGPARGDLIALGDDVVERPFQVRERGHEPPDPARSLGDPDRVWSVCRPMQVAVGKDLRHDVEVPHVVDLGADAIDDRDRLLGA